MKKTLALALALVGALVCFGLLHAATADRHFLAGGAIRAPAGAR